MAEEIYIEQEVIVQNHLGLHARPAALLSKLAAEFSCDLHAEVNGEKMQLRSIMSILMMAAGKGTMLKIRGCGADAERAVAAITDLINSKFGEE